MLLVRTSIEGSNQFGDVFAWLFVGCFIGCAVLNLKVLNEGLAQFEAMLVIPIYYVVSTLLTMLAGELLYRTYRDFTRAGAASFAAGVSLSLYGVYLLAHHDPEDEAIKLRPMRMSRGLWGSRREEARARCRGRC